MLLFVCVEFVSVGVLLQFVIFGGIVVLCDYLCCDLVGCCIVV